MDAYLVPVLATVAAAWLAASALGAVRVWRWWSSLGGEASEAPWTRGPGVAGHVADPHVPRMAHRTLAAALLLSWTAVFFFVEPRASAPPGGLDLSAAAALPLLAAWAVTWIGR